MTPRVEDIHEAIREIADSHDITIKHLVNKTGYQKTTIYDFFSGKLVTLPVCLTLLTTIWEMTGDARLLLMGRREAIAVIELPEVCGSDVDMRLVVEHTRKFGAMLESLADIFADGKVDSQDRLSVAAYGKAVDDMINVLIKSKHSLECKI